MIKPVPILRSIVNGLLRLIIPLELTLAEGTLLLNPKDPVLSGALMLRVFEKHFTEIFRKSLSEGMTVVDVGANIGYYTLIAGKRVGMGGRVIAFEPEPENLGFLKHMIGRNSLGNTEALPYALSDDAGDAWLYLHPDNKGKHSLLPTAGHTPVTVHTETLDTLLLAMKVAQVDIIKMDIEGWEAKALRGAQRSLAIYRPKLFFEFAPVRIWKTNEDPLVLLRMLTNLGYALAKMDEFDGTLAPIHDHEAFVATFTGYDDYANICGTYVGLK